MNQSIKSKLVTGFSLVLLLLFIVSFFVSNKLAETNERLVEMVEVSSRKISLSHEILIEMLDATRQEKNLILAQDSYQKEVYRSKMEQSIAALDDKIPQLEELLTDKGAKDFAQFKKLWAEYKIPMNEIVALTMKGENDRAFEISSTSVYKIREEILDVIQRIVARNEKKMEEDKLESDKSYQSALNLIIALIIAGLVLSVLVAAWIIRSITNRISFITAEAEKIASREYTDSEMKDGSADELKPVFQSLVSVNTSFKEVTEHANKVAMGDYAANLTPRSDKDLLGNALKKMTASLRESTAANEKHNWLTSGQNQLNEKLIGEQDMEELAAHTITFLSSYLNANIGAIYLLNERENLLVLSGEYAFLSREDVKEKFALGEGLIGQVASGQEALYITDIKEDEMRISSSILHAKPKNLFIFPILFEGRALGVLEIGKRTAFTEAEKEFMNNCMESIAISINSALARKRIQELLEETQVQSEELQSQQEELKQINEELEEQTQNLKQQQEELQMTNEELEEQTQSLEMKNKEVEAAKFDIEHKTKQLEISSKYKSEFLANMSHELRTPLNSLLILSRDLAENKRKNLSNDQVESAEIIYKSGTDLLLLINEVLDLSKIEAGKMNITIERLSLTNLVDDLFREFKYHADQKGLRLVSTLEKGLPESIRTDAQRLNQILKNLLSNAIKFTEKGNVKVNIAPRDESSIIIQISDTGIGIPEEKQMAIFEAFQQADGGTSRKYGGTGLGLSISRELARLLGIEIKLSSVVNEGSTFSLIVPLEIQQENEPGKTKSTTVTDQLQLQESSQNSFLNYPTINDDRDAIREEDKVVLIIEDDMKFAAILLKQANDKGFKCLSAATGEDGLLLAEKYKLQAIILDLDLPGMSGKRVLEELKSNPKVRHIPVHIMSVNERTIETIMGGAVEYLMKPVSKKDLEEAFNRIENFASRKMKNLLIIEDDANARKAMLKLIGNGDVKCFEAGTGKEALNMYRKNHFDCIVLDIGLPDMTGFELIYELEKLKVSNMPPIIIYTGKELTKEENNELQKYAESIIIKGVKSEERLLDETALFLHRTISNLPESKQIIINKLYDKEAVFQSKKILLVDDDMRNVFALSKILKERGMEVVKADNGKIALEMLDKHAGIDLVLMDIMMPEMDGYEAMRRIREQGRFKSLPVIALTAKAMKDDKQKCIDAGANDYITKPVDVDRLLSLMRVWLSK